MPGRPGRGRASAATRDMRWHALQSVLRLWFQGTHGQESPALSQASVGGNLWRQSANRRTLHRLSRNARHLWNWERRYFENFCKCPRKPAGRRCWTDRSCSTASNAGQLFHEVTLRSAATDPADKVMHWDLQTYLPGLFHQDDRMSMAASLESRVPLADPRMVLFAMHTGFDLKFRGGCQQMAVAESRLGRTARLDSEPAQGWLRHARRRLDEGTTRRIRSRFVALSTIEESGHVESPRH